MIYTLTFSSGSETGEDSAQRLLKEIKLKNRQIGEKDRRIKEQSAQLAQLKTLLASRDEELAKALLDLNQKLALLAQIQDALPEASNSSHAQSSELPRNKAPSNRGNSDSESTERKEREQESQERLETLERMVAEAST
ncbi:hypothetical protein FRC07_007742 [Ceratobasidium sp. 392]|nr:hypothetical protein FRC07_007742 [Ceratobasidium sp. 392]